MAGFPQVLPFRSKRVQPGRFIECEEVLQQIHRDVLRLPQIRDAITTLCQGDRDAINCHMRRIARLLFVFSFINTDASPRKASTNSAASSMTRPALLLWRLK
jgi:hypothetical protein